MKNTGFILSLFALLVVGCKNQPKNTTEQESDVCISISEEYSDSVKIQPENKNETEIDTVNWKKFISKYNFATFSTEVFTGKLANPDFTGSEFEHERFVTHITEVCSEEGITFGGHYTIVRFGCGAMCEGLVVVDRISGKIFDVELTSDEYGDAGKYGFLFQSDSKLLIANSEVLSTDLTQYCTIWGKVPELYVWKGKNFKRIQ
jgi:hypothetical protein